MIRSRRLVHRYLFTILAPVLGVTLAAGLLLRPDVPPVLPLDPAIANEAGFVPSVDSRPVRIETEEYVFEALVEPETGGLVVAIRPTTVILRPDLLVYWVGDAAAMELPSEGAVLAGSLSGTSYRRLSLPAIASQEPGTMLVYSLAHGEVITRFPASALLEPASRPGD